MTVLRLISTVPNGTKYRIKILGGDTITGTRHERGNLLESLGIDVANAMVYATYPLWKSKELYIEATICYN